MYRLQPFSLKYPKVLILSTRSPKRTILKSHLLQRHFTKTRNRWKSTKSLKSPIQRGKSRWSNSAENLSSQFKIRKNSSLTSQKKREESQKFRKKIMGMLRKCRYREMKLALILQEFGQEIYLFISNHVIKLLSVP